MSKTLGKITLEMYGIQMIFGFDFANKILLKTGNIVETNVLTVLFVVVASAMGKTTDTLIKMVFHILHV